MADFSKKERLYYQVPVIEDGNIRLESKHKEYHPSSVYSVYSGVLYRLFRLRPLDRYLMDWFCMKMNDENQVITIKGHLEDFLNNYNVAAEQSGQRQYSYNSIPGAVKRLKKAGMLIADRRGMAYVNPEYFFRGNKKLRVDSIKMTLQITNNMIIAEAEAGGAEMYGED